MSRPRLQRLFWLGAAAILVAAALVALVAVVRGDFSDTDGRILGTLAVVLLSFATLLSGLALADRDSSWRLLGWGVAAAAPVCFLLVLPAVWTPFDENGDDDWRLAWTGILVLVAALFTTTALLLADRAMLRRLAMVAGSLAGAAAAVSIAAVWSENPGDGIAKALGALWILATLAYLLVPVMSRFSRPADDDRAVERVLAELDGVALVATSSGEAGVAIDELLRRGDRLVLRSVRGNQGQAEA